MNLKPQDVLILLKLLLKNGERWIYDDLERELHISRSQISNSIKRAEYAALYNANKKRPIISALRNFIVHGVPYAFPVKPGAVVRGIPTAYASPFMSQHIDSDDMPPVWESDLPNSVRGISIEPLHPSVPLISSEDSEMYNLLGIVDSMRYGDIRESNLAENEFNNILNKYAPESVFA